MMFLVPTQDAKDYVHIIIVDLLCGELFWNGRFLIKSLFC